VNYAILIVGIIGIVAAVGIAVWQHRELSHYRRADRELETQHAEQESLRRARRARRDSWEPGFTEIQELLIKLEDIESEAREQGPLSHDVIDAADLGRLQRRLENVSERCPDTLHDPLLAVAMVVAKFRRVIIKSDTEVTDEYASAVASTPPGDPAPRVMADALGAKAIEQDRAAVDLHHAIGKSWEAVQTERGGTS